MIPNSQIVVIPSPLRSPDRSVHSCENFSTGNRCHSFSWQTKLFITASRMILHTGIALGITLVIIVVVMAILHYREKVK
jgi:hypothetical protein